jgi:ABC-2 type transport system ATP-binding protein
MAKSVGRNDLLIFEGISKKYKDLLALDNVSFKIEEGEIFGYIGPNGAGKTTTIKIIVGLLKQSKGNLYVGGLPMPDEKDKVHKLLGYLPQEVSFQDWRTVDDALTTFGKLSGLEKDVIDHRIERSLDIFNLSDVRYKKIIELSGGMVQKVGLAQALLHNPKLLVLDEPLTGFDPETRYQVKQIFKKLSKNGTTIFFSSHILSDVQDIATKIGILNQGRIMKIGTLDELKAHFPMKQEIEIVLSKDAGKLKKLEAIKGVKAIKQTEPNKLLVHFDSNVDIDEFTNDLIQQLIKLDYHVRSFNPVSISLDEVYLQYLRGGA